MQQNWNGKKTLRRRMYELFDGVGHNDFETSELVARFDCSTTAAQRYRRQWSKRRYPISEYSNVTCDECEHLSECRQLDALHLPVRCETVTDDDRIYVEKVRRC